MNFGAGRRIRPKAKAASDQNCVIGERSGCVRMAAFSHLTHTLERAGSRYVKLRVGAPIPPGHLVALSLAMLVRNSLVRSSFTVSRSLAAFSNSNFLAASRMSDSSLAM